MAPGELLTYSFDEAADVAGQTLAYCNRTRAQFPDAVHGLGVGALAFREILRTAPYDLERLGELSDLLEEARDREGSFFPTFANYVCRYLDHHALARQSAMGSVFVDVHLNGAVRSVPFDKTELSVGRAPENDIVLDDPNEWVAERHCLIRRLDDGFRVTDLGTTIGTSAGGRCFIGEHAVIALRGSIGMGPARLVLVEKKPPYPNTFPEAARRARYEGNLHASARLFGEAIAELRHGAATARRLAPLHSALAHVCRKAGDLDGALAAARVSVALRQTVADAPLLLGNDLLILARVLADRNELDEALEAAKAALPCYAAASPEDALPARRDIAVLTERRTRPTETTAHPAPPIFRAPPGAIFGVNRRAMLERARAAILGDTVPGVRLVESVARPEGANRTAFLVTVARHYRRGSVEETVLVLHEGSNLITRRSFGFTSPDLLEQQQWRIIARQRGRSAVVNDILSAGSDVLIPASVPLSISNGASCWDEQLAGIVTLPKHGGKLSEMSRSHFVRLHEGDLLRGTYALFMFGWVEGE